MFEDSWVGSKLARYLCDAGYEHVQEKRYRVVRHAPLDPDFRSYLQGITNWFVCEGAPFLSQAEIDGWLECFADGEKCAFDRDTFVYEETEYMVTGVWPANSTRTYVDMRVELLEPCHAGC